MNVDVHSHEPAPQDKTPYVMGGLIGAFAVAIITIYSLSVATGYLIGTSQFAAVISAVLVDLTNGERSTNALGGLTINPVLTAAAQAKANDMAAKSYFAHISPEGKNSWYWFTLQGYKFLYAGENLAVDFSDSVDVEQAWMHSPTHRANILDGNFTEIGIATAQGMYQDRPTTFVVQMFGTPARTAQAAPVREIVAPKEPTVPALATTQPKIVATKPKVVVKAPEPAVATATIARAKSEQILGTETGAVVSARSASWWEYLLASPKTMLRYAFYGFAGVLLLLLAFITEFEFHRRHLRHVVAAIFLIVFMAGLFIYADTALFREPIVAALLN